jgi:hypothetical protein
MSMMDSANAAAGNGDVTPRSPSVLHPRHRARAEPQHTSPYLPPLADALPRDEPSSPELTAMLERCAHQRPRYFIDALQKA